MLCILQGGKVRLRVLALSSWEGYVGAPPSPYPKLRIRREHHYATGRASVSCKSFHVNGMALRTIFRTDKRRSILDSLGPVVAVVDF
jgi:hypothetical protein